MADSSLPEKQCKTCGEVKPLSAFWINGTYAHCIPCMAVRRRASYAADVTAKRAPRVTPSERKCKTCGEVKPISDFYGKFLHRAGALKFYPGYQCNACRSERRREATIASGRMKRIPCNIIDGQVIHPEKYCVKCGEDKPIAEFRVKTYGVTKDGGKYPRAIATHCLSCEKEHKGHYYDRRAEEVKRKAREARDADPQAEKRRACRSYLKKTLRKFGLTPDDYSAMYMAQNGCCKTCGTHKNRLGVDHCHTTNKVRGLLCVKCNTALGMANDSPALLRLLADYLDQSRE